MWVIQVDLTSTTGEIVGTGPSPKLLFSDSLTDEKSASAEETNSGLHTLVCA
jgi:hypothetical protein